MAVLGIESSAHTLGIGVIQNGAILANVKQMFEISKGIIPAKTADFHAQNVGVLITRALEQAKITKENITAVGYTKGPGIGPCLEIAQIAALCICSELNIPIIPVNHSVGHIEITKHIFKFKDPLALYVSGGNSQILALTTSPYRHYHVYGETFDIGIGNMLDSFARASKINPPWGSSVDKYTAGGKYIKMPYSVKGMDFTFAGLLTNAIMMLPFKRLNDICYSLEETAFSMLCESTERALLLLGKREIVLCGGVAQSSRLKHMIIDMAKAHGAKVAVAPNEYNADNGAMIALVAEKMLKSGIAVTQKDCTIDQKYRIDGIKITW